MYNKLEYLKIKWDDPSLTKGMRTRYNQFISDTFHKVMDFELKLESILFDVLNTEEPILLNEIFANKLFKQNGISNKFTPSNNTHDALMVVKKELSLSNKILMWKYMKKSYKDDLLLFSKKANKEFYTNILENMRNVRNGIAHYHSIEWINKHMRTIDGEKVGKETIKETFRKVGV